MGDTQEGFNNDDPVSQYEKQLAKWKENQDCSDRKEADFLAKETSEGRRKILYQMRLGDAIAKSWTHWKSKRKVTMQPREKEIEDAPT
jgi:hypothetical protein